MNQGTTMTSSEPSVVERVARAIAVGLGDDFAHAFASKSDWIAARGDSGGRYRDVNEPMQDDYRAAARAAIEAMRGPTEEMLAAVNDGWPYPDPLPVWQAMIDAALGEQP